MSLNSYFHVFAVSRKMIYSPLNSIITNTYEDEFSFLNKNRIYRHLIETINENNSHIFHYICGNEKTMNLSVNTHYLKSLN